MTIASEITRLQKAKSGIVSALNAKHIEVDSGTKMDGIPALVEYPQAVKIGLNYYPVVKIGRQLWTAADLKEVIGTLGTDCFWMNDDKATYEKKGCGLYYKVGKVNLDNDYPTNAINEILPTGWRVPKSSDYSKLLSALGGYTKARELLSTSDTRGFMAIVGGYKHENGNYQSTEQYYCITSTKDDNGKYKTFNINGGNGWIVNYFNDNTSIPLRLCLDLDSVVKIGNNYYPIVKIGDQWWTAENLKEPIGTEGETYWWYNNDKEKYEAKHYGLLYKWDALCSGSDTMSAELKNLLPSGWRLPNKNDVTKLYSTCGETSSERYYNLASITIGGNGSLGFNGLPNGRKNQDGTFSYGSSNSYLITSSKVDGKTFIYSFNSANKQAIILNADLCSGARLVKDDESAVATLAEDGVAVASVEPSTDSES